MKDNTGAGLGCQGDGAGERASSDGTTPGGSGLGEIGRGHSSLVAAECFFVKPQQYPVLLRQFGHTAFLGGRGITGRVAKIAGIFNMIVSHALPPTGPCCNMHLVDRLCVIKNRRGVKAKGWRTGSWAGRGEALRGAGLRRNG